MRQGEQGPKASPQGMKWMPGVRAWGWALAFAGLALVGTSQAWAGEIDPDQAMERIEDSVVMVLATHGLGEQSLGSGFFVRPHVVATSLATLRDRNAGEVTSAESWQRRPILGLLAMDKARDLALVQVGGPAGEPVELQKPGQAMPGEPVLMLSHANGLGQTQGQLQGEDPKDGTWGSSLRFGHGMAGALVINGRGLAVGMAVAPGRSGGTLLQPAHLLGQLLQQAASSPTPLGQVWGLANVEPPRAVVEATPPPPPPPPRASRSAGLAMRPSGTPSPSGRMQAAAQGREGRAAAAAPPPPAAPPASGEKLPLLPWE